jgi:hypothetical protein
VISNLVIRGGPVLPFGHDPYLALSIQDGIGDFSCTNFRRCF